MAEIKNRKAGIINVLWILIEPYRFDKKEIDKRRVRRLFFSILISLALVLMITVPDEIFNPNPTPIFLAIIRIILGITIGLSLTLIVVVNDRNILRNYLILIGWIILGFIFKRFRFPTAGILIASSLCVLALGNFILCVKYLGQISKNKYLMIMGSIGAFIIANFSLAIITKYMHWPAQDIFQALSLGPILLLTFIILATLPNSGFITWGKKQKDILTKRLFIPWVFLMIFTAMRLLLPADISNKIFSKDNESISPFYMNDFEILHKEGLEEEFNK